MPRATPSTPAEPWTDTHTLALLRALVDVALAARPALYAVPALSTQAANGGDRINKKLRVVLDRMCAAAGQAGEGIVGDAVRARAGGGKGKGKAGGKRKVADGQGGQGGQSKRARAARAKSEQSGEGESELDDE